MKRHHLIWMVLISFAGILASCTKEPLLFYYQTGAGTTLSSASPHYMPVVADSNKFGVKFNFTQPNMATDWSNVKFITEVDIAGRNFSNPLRSTSFGTLSDSMQNKVINKFLLDNGVPYFADTDMQARTTVSYSNNNDQKLSNTIVFKFRTYKVPPKVPLPTTGRLYLVGNATQGGWTNPVPVPSQEFSRIDETTFAGVFQLNGGGQYLMLPLNGNWDNKYSITSGSATAAGGDFGFNLPTNFPGPAADGLYTITVDFQLGKFKVEPFTMQHGLPTVLVMVGGATPGGWDNSAGNTQKLTRLNSSEFQINSINLKANDGYLVLPEPGSWGKKYGVPDRSLESARISGPFKPEGQDFKSPTVAGNYRFNINYATGQYKLTKL